MKQHTLREPIHFTGKGLHTGLEIAMTLKPAPINTGYQLKRTDLENTPAIPLWAELVTQTERSTVIQREKVSVSTVEHVLSALYALGVDNCLIEVSAPECPILTGNAVPYVEAIERVGLEEQNADREYYVVKKRMEVTDPESGSRILLLPDSEFAIDAHISYPSPLLRNQFAGYDSHTHYATEIAPARSFVFVREIMPLLKKGLIQGGDLSNALVLNDTELSHEEQQFLSTHLSARYTVPQNIGYINPNEELTAEPARHKVLDLIGDLALVGKFIQGRVVAYSPGHKINNQMARLIRKEIKSIEAQAPYYNPDDTPVMDISRIKELLPHRYPFLLVDKIIEIKSNSIVGVKSVSGNEPFFQGHFPEEPVMPGVLLLEAMAQTGGLLILSGMPEGSNCSTYFLKINNVKFRQKVVPGDTILFRLRLTSEVVRGIANMRGLAYVGEKLVCEAEFMAQIVSNK